MTVMTHSTLHTVQKLVSDSDTKSRIDPRSLVPVFVPCASERKFLAPQIKTNVVDKDNDTDHGITDVDVDARSGNCIIGRRKKQWRTAALAGLKVHGGSRRVRHQRGYKEISYRIFTFRMDGPHWEAQEGDPWTPGTGLFILEI